MSNQNQTADATIEAEVKDVTPAAVEVKTQNPWIRAGLTALKVMGICGVSYVSYKVGQASMVVKANEAAATAAKTIEATPQSI